MEAQNILLWVSLGFATVCFWVSMLWHALWGRQYDWVEKIARSIFVWLQAALWGGVLGSVLLMTVFGVDFGGAK